MSLCKKTFLIIGMSVFGIIAITYAILGVIAAGGFIRLENMLADKADLLESPLFFVPNELIITQPITDHSLLHTILKNTLM